MSIKDELIQYCYRCLNDEYINEFEDYISCYKHKQAVRRLLNDFEKEGTDEFPYIWVEEEAQKIVTWFTYLRHSKGILARTPIYLTVWQKFFLCQIYGWKHKDTLRRRFTKSFLECARKQAKSQMQGGVALYEMSTTAVKNKELTENYTAGVRREQSKIIFDEMGLMLNGSPLKSKFKITRDRITHIKTGSFTKPLSKEDRKSGDGTNINLLVLDEYHQHETSEYYDLFQGANSQESLLIIITTAGVNLSSPCFTQEYQYCSKILNGSIVNDSYFVDILEIDKDDNIEDRRNWWKANPIRMSYADGVKKLEEAYLVAKDIPEKMTSFLQKCLNQWQSKTTDGYMDMDKFKKCIVNKPPIDLKGRECFIGIDVGAKLDLCAITFCFPFVREDGLLCQYLENYSFIPNEDSLKYHIRVDKMPFDFWVKQGYVILTNSPIVDQKQLIEFIQKKKEEYGLKKITYAVDPSNASLLTTTLLDMGENVFEIFQSKKHLNEPTVALREQVYEGRIYFLNNPCYTWQMSNATIETNGELIKIDKKQQKKRIDNVDSTICALKLSMYWKEKISLQDRILSSDFIM